MEFDYRWIDFSNALQPKWTRQETLGREEVALTIKSGQTIAILTNTGIGIAIRIPHQSVEIRSILLETLNTEGLPYVIGCGGQWIPSAKHIQTLDIYTRSGIVTGYGSLNEALVASTNSMALQFAEEQVRLSNETSKPNFAKTVPSEFQDRVLKHQRDSIAVESINRDLEEQEMLGVIGKFLLAWQNLELNIRGLVLKAEKGGQPLKTLYRPSYEGLANRVERVIQKIDPDLCNKITQTIKHRNNIIHGLVIAREYPRRREAVIAHHDVVATALITHEEQNSETAVMFPVSGGEYNSELLVEITTETKLLSQRISNLLGNETALAVYQQTKDSAKRKGRRKYRSRSKQQR